MSRIYRMSHVPTATEYASGFSKINISSIQRAILIAQYKCPEHTTTATELAKAVGLYGHQPVNLQYGKLGRILCEAMGFEPDEREIGTYRWWSVLSEGWVENKSKFIWKMHSEVARALEILGWVEQEVLRLPEEIPSTDRIVEGAFCRVTVNAYERNPIARTKCIEHYGDSCIVCGFNFGSVYGVNGKGVIHVHHLRPLSEVREKYEIDPIHDLCPVCPNCHTMIHRRNPPYTIEELKQLLKNND